MDQYHQSLFEEKHDGFFVSSDSGPKYDFNKEYVGEQEAIMGPSPDSLQRHMSKDIDETDLGMSRQTCVLVPMKADFLDNIIALFAMVTYIADIVTDVLVAREYFVSKDWWWFGQTVVYIAFPSFLLQTLSCMWYVDDNFDQSWWEWLVHILQLGPVKRYFCAFWYGLQTWCTDQIDITHYERYLTEWRDITLLRLFEAFTEAAPQVILQLYILASLQRTFEWRSDWIIAVSAVISVVSLAWAIVSYTHSLRLCLRQKGLSICGYIFQTSYRLFIVTSRVVVLVLFASEYKLWVYLVCSSHWLVMFVWLRQYKTRFCSEIGNVRIWLERFFSAMIAFVYIFCFINTLDSTSRQRVSLYYFLFFIENSIMVALWYMRRKVFGWLEYSALGITWGGFCLGIVCMLFYHKFFHPSNDITEGWLCCKICQNEPPKPLSYVTVEVIEEKPLASQNSSPAESLLMRTVTPAGRMSQSDQSSPSLLSKQNSGVSQRSRRSLSLHQIIHKSTDYVPVDIELSLRPAISSENLYRIHKKKVEKKPRPMKKIKPTQKRKYKLQHTEETMADTMHSEERVWSDIQRARAVSKKSSLGSSASQRRMLSDTDNDYGSFSDMSSMVDCSCGHTRRDINCKVHGVPVHDYRRQLTTEPRLRNQPLLNDNRPVPASSWQYSYSANPPRMMEEHAGTQIIMYDNQEYLMSAV